MKRVTVSIGLANGDVKQYTLERGPDQIAAHLVSIPEGAKITVVVQMPSSSHKLIDGNRGVLKKRTLNGHLLLEDDEQVLVAFRDFEHTPGVELQSFDWAPDSVVLPEALVHASQATQIAVEPFSPDSTISSSDYPSVLSSVARAEDLASNQNTTPPTFEGFDWSSVGAYVAPIGLLAVAGGSGGSASDTTSGPVVTKRNMRVVDGPIKGAKVYVDLDNDGIVDVGEPEVGTTDSDGNAEVTFTNNLWANLSLLAKDGTDTTTGISFKGILAAPAGSTVINPLTTLVAAMVGGDNGKSVADAQAVVIGALGLEGISDITTYDTYASALSGDANGLKNHLKAVQIANVIVAGSALLSQGGTSQPIGQASSNLLNAFVDKISATQTSIALDAAFLTDVLTRAGALQSEIGDVVHSLTLINAKVALASDLDAAADAQTFAQGDLVTAITSKETASIQELIKVIAVNLTLAGDTGSSNSDGITNNGTINVGNIEDGATWQYSLDGGANWAAGSGTSFVLPQEKTYSANQIQVRQTDKAGNIGPVGNLTTAITLDKTAPAALNLTLAGDTGSSNSDGITNNGTINVGNIEDGATWQYSLDGGANWAAGSGTSFVLPQEKTYSANQIQVRQTDKAGNIGPAGNLTTAITLDKTAPALNLTLAGDTGSSKSDGITNNGTINVSGLEDGATWQYSLDGGANWAAGSGTSFVLTQEKTYSANQIQVRQTDKAGNIGRAGNLTTAITLDKTAPAALNLTLAGDTGSSNSDGITNNGTINVGGLEGGATWQYSLDGGANWATGRVTSFVLPQEKTYSANQIQVRQTDKAGNIGPAGNLTTAITLDKTAPAALNLTLASDTGSSNSDGITNNGTINVGNIEDGATWQYSLDGGANWATGSGTSFDLAEEKTYEANQIQVRQTDKAGNIGRAGNLTTAITLDKTAPAALNLTLAGDTGSSNSDGITNNATINVGGLEDGATWQYSLDGGANWATGSGTSFDLAEEKTYEANQIQVRQTYKAGNNGPAGNLTTAITLDKTAPAALNLTLAGDTGSGNSDGITNNGTINVGNIEDGATWQYSLDGGANWATGSGTSFVLTQLS